MAFSTPPSPPSAAAVSRRPFFVRWWYVPVQRRRVIIATVLALLYGSGLAYGSWTRVCAAERCPSITRIDPHTGRNVPKDTILELYLNQISLGPNVAGVEAASQVFFGKSARDLNVAEAATLAALPKAPGTYNPRTHPDRAVRRRNAVLSLMHDQGFLSAEDAEYWKVHPLVLTTRRTSYRYVAP